MNRTCLARQLSERGYAIVEGLSAAAVQEARQRVIAHAGLLKKTRPNPSAGHIAGFHRYPELEHLHALVSSDPNVLGILQAATGCSQIRSIGLSDITVNRSQPWHVDLLRGPYQSHLAPELCWGPDGGGVYKVLLYLQPGVTLKVIPGAHKQPVPLDDDRKAAPQSPAEAEAVAVGCGGIVLMDIRLPHCGSTDEELADPSLAHDPKILISTVLAGAGMPLGDAMERGNIARLLDWDEAHRDSGSPRLVRQQSPTAPERA